MKPQKHIAQFRDRVVEVTVEEKPNRVIFALRFSKAAPWRAKDFKRFKHWLWQIIYPYDSDPRPSVFINGMTGEEYILFAPPDGPGLQEPPF